ncbi:MAG: hypothetical protein K0R24_1368 [Gammaproteobacteria bacterium]|jgi:integrase|nr:hypothetical protein [Gammaproteobacteria bacterium]
MHGDKHVGRLRKAKYQGLPPNLFFDKNWGGYKYRRPDTKKFCQMGKDKVKAVSAAKQLNSLLMPGQDLVANVIGTRAIIQQFVDEKFIPILKERDIVPSTRTCYFQQLVIIKDKLGQLPIDSVTVHDIAAFLDQFVDKPRTFNRYRGVLCDMFKHAIAYGLCEQNPAANTIKKKLIKKRLRLKLNEFNAIYEIADPWLKNAMDLALLTLQRLETVTSMRFDNIKVENVNGREVEFLYVIQKKTKKHGSSAYLKIELGVEIKKIIQRCRDEVVSPYLVHRIPEKASFSTKKMLTKSHRTQVTPTYLTRAFSEARDATGLFSKLEIGPHPTFHEIRSLGIALYENNGIDAQKLAGHTTRNMTNQYQQGHDIQWTLVTANLKLVK